MNEYLTHVPISEKIIEMLRKEFYDNAHKAKTYIGSNGIKSRTLEEMEVIRWEGLEPPDEAALREIYKEEGMSPYAWSNGPGDVYPSHTHPYHKVIYTVRGSIAWVLPESNRRIETYPGDRVDLPRGTLHGAEVGSRGVTCLEGHI